MSLSCNLDGDRLLPLRFQASLDAVQRYVESCKALSGGTYGRWAGQLAWSTEHSDSCLPHCEYRRQDILLIIDIRANLHRNHMDDVNCPSLGRP